MEEKLVSGAGFSEGVFQQHRPILEHCTAAEREQGGGKEEHVPVDYFRVNDQPGGVRSAASLGADRAEIYFFSPASQFSTSLMSSGWFCSTGKRLFLITAVKWDFFRKLSARNRTASVGSSN